MPSNAGVGVAVIVLREGRVLLLRRQGSHGSGTWAPPGGHIDFGETIEQCAIRETREETGVEIGNIRFHGITNDIFEEEGKHYVTVWMEADWVYGEASVIAPDEASEIGWFAPAALPSPLFLCFNNLLDRKGYFIP